MRVGLDKRKWITGTFKEVGTLGPNDEGVIERGSQR